MHCCQMGTKCPILHAKQDPSVSHSSWLCLSEPAAAEPAHRPSFVSQLRRPWCRRRPIAPIARAVRRCPCCPASAPKRPRRPQTTPSRSPPTQSSLHGTHQCSVSVTAQLLSSRREGCLRGIALSTGTRVLGARDSSKTFSQIFHKEEIALALIRAFAYSPICYLPMITLKTTMCSPWNHSLRK
jgi:hypothetical protein